MPVYNPEEFLEIYSNQPVLIATAFYHEEIYWQLLSYGIGEDKIINAGKLMVDLFDAQYFDLPFYPMSRMRFLWTQDVLTA